jgi:hypothetical protein
LNLEYLKKLQNHSLINGIKDEGISEEEIRQLEQSFNRGKTFPKVVRELLFLAGNFCHFLDYSIYDSQLEMQTEERGELLSFFKVTIARPHFFVCLASHGMPVFLYLDEGDDPNLHQIVNHPTQDNYSRPIGCSLKTLINHRIERYKSGYNPF